MDRAMPSSSRIITNAATYKNMSIHYEKLNNIKPVLTHEFPDLYYPRKKEYKKREIEKSRLQEIEKGNNLLMQKLTKIMSPTAKQQATERYHKESSHRINRKKELVKISEENRGVMKRIVNQKSHYSRDNWEKDHQKKMDYLRNMSDYGFVNDHFYAFKNPRTINSARNRALKEKQSTSVDRSDLSTPRGKSTSSTPRHMGLRSLHGSLDSTGGSMDDISPERTHSLEPKRIQSAGTRYNRNDKLAPIADAKKKLLYQTTRTIGIGTYHIHVYFSEDTFNIIASNNDRSDLKTLVMTKRGGEELLARYQSDFQHIADMIRFRGPNEIVLEEDHVPISGPKFVPLEKMKNSAIMEREDESFLALDSNNPTRHNSKIADNPANLYGYPVRNDKDKVLDRRNTHESRKESQYKPSKNGGSQGELPLDKRSLDEAVKELAEKQLSDDYDDYSSEEEHYEVVKEEEPDYEELHRAAEEKKKKAEEKKNEEEKKKREEKRRQSELKKEAERKAEEERHAKEKREEEKRKQEEKKRKEDEQKAKEEEKRKLEEKKRREEERAKEEEERKRKAEEKKKEEEKRKAFEKQKEESERIARLAKSPSIPNDYDFDLDDNVSYNKPKVQEKAQPKKSAPSKAPAKKSSYPDFDQNQDFDFDEAEY